MKFSRIYFVILSRSFEIAYKIAKLTIMAEIQIC